jgi:DNA-binding LytR/AlgR family response regulator
MAKLNILLVEDEAIVAKDIASCLEKLGHNVVGIAAEGKIALELIKETKPNLILMDITLKGDMDGIDVSNYIKDTYKTPVILQYSLPDNSDIDEVLFVKSNYTLVKIHVKELAFVEALKDYVIFNTKDNRYVVHATMKSMVEKLSTKHFIRVHRSFIVRENFIKSVSSQNLTLEHCEKEIPIGGSYKTQLMERLNLM